ncbi:MAG: CHC2 zinc finger domain-containing protein [Minisyncoccia bacterium]|jgi:hypothetical protein
MDSIAVARDEPLSPGGSRDSLAPDLLAESGFSFANMTTDITKQFYTDEQNEEYDFFRELEEEWHKSLPRLNDFAWLEVFPEAKETLPEKIKEWEAEKQRLIGITKKYLRENISKDYWETWVALRVLVEPRILAAAKHIARLQRQVRHLSPHPMQGRITDADIQYAKDIPITSLISSSLRKTGRTITTNCPLHADRSPSFVIYPETNSCWCFGCQQGGDSIALTQLLHNFPFIEAVKFLLRV